MSKGTRIESIGVYLPEKRLSTATIEERLKLSKPLKLELLTGIAERRICSGNEDSLILAVEAIVDCLKYSSISSSGIEMIIYCGISKYKAGLTYIYEPDISLFIKHKLGNHHAINFDISNACAGMLTGIHIGANFIERGIVDNCMVVSGEYITSLCHNAMKNIKTRTSPEVASLTLGDAGAAVMLCKTSLEQEKIRVSRFVTLGKYSDLCIGYQSRSQAGGIMETQMKKIHDVSIRHAPEIIEEALNDAGMTLDQVDYLIPHQTSRMAIQAGRKHFSGYFGKMAKNIVVNLEELGNTASTSHILALYRLLSEKRIKKGDQIMLLSFASGLVIGVMIFPMNEITERYGDKN